MGPNKWYSHTSDISSVAATLARFICVCLSYNVTVSLCCCTVCVYVYVTMVSQMAILHSSLPWMESTTEILLSIKSNMSTSNTFQDIEWTFHIIHISIKLVYFHFLVLYFGNQYFLYFFQTKTELWNLTQLFNWTNANKYIRVIFLTPLNKAINKFGWTSLYQTTFYLLFSIHKEWEIIKPLNTLQNKEQW